jgi:hypothetical protein
VWSGVSLGEGKTAKRNVPSDGAILEEQVGHFNQAGQCLDDMGSNLSTYPRATTELDSFQRLFRRPFQVCPHVGSELDYVVHGVATFRDPAAPDNSIEALACCGILFVILELVAFGCGIDDSAGTTI